MKHLISTILLYGMRIVLLGAAGIYAYLSTRTFGYGGIILGCMLLLFATTSILGFCASFMRGRFAMYSVFASFLTAFAVMWIGTDTLALRGAWWELVIVFPIQMSFPSIAVYFCFAEPSFRARFVTSEVSLDPS